MKKIIVTGHNGYIGSLLVKLLKESNYEVCGIDTNFYGKECAFFNPELEISELNKDIRKINGKDIRDAYAICHLAAISNDPMGDINPELTLDINYSASLKLAETAKRAGVKKFIYSSSCSMYGISDGSRALDESAEFNPITAYAKSKVESEKDIMPLADKNFSVTFLRNTTAYGISPKLRLDLVVNNMVGWAVTTGKIRIMSDGTPWRPLVHAEDIARAFIVVVESSEELVNKKSYNVGITSENYQIKDIAKIISEVIPDTEIIITGEHGSDSRSYKVNFNKIHNELKSFTPKWTLKKGIEEIYGSFLQYKMDDEKFNGRYFTRIKQIKYLLNNNLVDNNLFWIK